jgi:hypothetical protein
LQHTIAFATLASAVLLATSTALAGPPYLTDDPEPVEYQHWEVYLASQHEVTTDGATGTAPHFEVNYGAAPNLQLHIIAPLEYARPSGGPTSYGPGDIELGTKLRFVEERDGVPMIGTFPMLELPLGNAAKGLGTGHVHGFIPLWLQKSLGPWSSYGGGGYWLNPGEGHRDFVALGWQAQRRLGELAALGAEIFYTSADRIGGRYNLRFNIGLVVDATSHHHVLVSAGRSIVGDSRLLGYLAYQLTL